MSIKTLKVIVGFENGVMGECGALEYEGAIWLVPKWLPFPLEGYTKPERMILLDQFRYQSFPQPADADFAINDPLPRDLFFGELSQAIKDKYVVLDKPDAKFRADGRRH
jgi:hypothetical protein